MQETRKYWEECPGKNINNGEQYNWQLHTLWRKKALDGYFEIIKDQDCKAMTRYEGIFVKGRGEYLTAPCPCNETIVKNGIVEKIIELEQDYLGKGRRKLTLVIILEKCWRIYMARTNITNNGEKSRIMEKHIN
ncbi:MAG: hypothetical protein ACRCU6_02895 [Fusobacteriaceae bacterium]